MMYGQMEPDYSSALALLRPFSSDDLKRFLNEDEQLDDMIKDLPQVKNIDVEKEMLMVSNKSLAEFNLSREPRLRQARQRLCESYEKASEHFQELSLKKQQLDELAKQVSLDATLAILQTSAALSEEETENVAEKFLEGSAEVEPFLEDFIPKRKLAHLRRVKVDKLSELLFQTQSRPSSSVTTHTWVPTSNPYGGASNLHMPMPEYNPVAM